MTREACLQAIRATTSLLACTSLVLNAAGSDIAVAKRPMKKSASLKALGGPSPDAGGAQQSVLPSTVQLTFMRTAIAAAPAFFAGRPTGCRTVTPMLASERGPILAGNFRDADSNCYIWLNLRQSATLTGAEICKTTLHELGHLIGLGHSPDPSDVMYTPFHADPVPAPCTVRRASAKRAKGASN